MQLMAADKGQCHRPALLSCRPARVISGSAAAYHRERRCAHDVRPYEDSLALTPLVIQLLSEEVGEFPNPLKASVPAAEQHLGVHSRTPCVW